MIVDSRKESDSKGFNPNVDNTIVKPNATNMQKIGWYLMIVLGCLTIIIGIILIVKSVQYKNFFQRKQIEINNASGTIDVMLTKRRDTLIKLLEETKSYMKFEKDVLTNITSLRTVGNQNSKEDKDNLEKIVNKVSKDISLVFENYPNLKSNTVIMELMSSSQYLETEISSARRLYNQNVSEFNSEIFIFPKIVIASKMHLSTFSFFSASDEQKKDINMSSLNNL